MVFLLGNAFEIDFGMSSEGDILLYFYPVIPFISPPDELKCHLYVSLFLTDLFH